MKTPTNWMTAILKIDSITKTFGNFYTVLGYRKNGTPIISNKIQLTLK